MEPVESDVMEHPPKPKEEGIFAHGLGVRIVLQGALFALLSLIAFWIGISTTGVIEGGRTMAFIVLALSQVVHSFNMRSHHSLFKIGFFTNKYLGGAALLSLLLMVFVVFIPPVATAFGLIQLSGVLYLEALGLSLVPLLVLEVSKALGLIRSHR